MTFKKLKLTKPEKIWLQEVLKKNFENINEDDLKVYLRNQLSENFDPEKIDQRVYKYGRLTLVGIWHIDSSNHLFKVCEKIILRIKERIINKEKPREFKIEKLASELRENTLTVGIGLLLLNDLGFVKGGSWIRNTMAFQDASLMFKNPYDKYIHYKSLDISIEKYFQKYKPFQKKQKSNMNNKPSKLISDVNQIWKEIEGEYNISKRAFGHKIKFIPSSHKKTALFRDISHAYILTKNNFPKPAVILAGSVIEEMLRLYLKTNNKKATGSFSELIELCKDHQLLIDPLNNLSDSARHFRNFVHLEKEKSARHELKPSNAIGAVSSIFSIANGFS